MAYEGWLDYNGVELVNHARTVALATALGIDTVRLRADSVSWITETLGGFGFGEGPFGEGPFGGGSGAYSDITNAPWYDSGYEASTEFAGFLMLSLSGLDDSSLESSPIEYITDGGTNGKSRNATQALVASVVLVASTERGAEYGKRWMDRTLRNSGANTFCAGADLWYFRYAEEDAPLVHRRDVKLTRGSSVTRRRKTNCATMWWATFTMTAADPYEYGIQQDVLDGLGGESPSGTPDLVDSGSLVLAQDFCPAYDYSPLYDPLYPALVASPTAPDFLPAGWTIVPGETFERFWAVLEPVEATTLNVVPIITLTSDVEARMVRVSIWPGDADTDVQCSPLFSVVVSYIPADLQFVVDGEQKAAYVWDGSSPVVRRTDSLVYSPDAGPVQWTAFNDPNGLLVTLDLFFDSGGYEGDGTVRAALALVPKSD